MLQLQLEELFTPELLNAFRARWDISPAQADRVALRTVRIFELQEKAVDKSASRRRKDAWLKLLVNALIGPEPDFLAWIEALATGNYDIRPGNYYARVEGKGQPSSFLLRQREHIEKLLAKEKLNPAEREERRIAYLDALRQILVAVLLRELKAACNGRAAVGPAWPMVKATEHLTVEELGTLRYFGGDEGFNQHLAETTRAAMTAWIDLRHGGEAPVLTKVYFQKGLPPSVTRSHALQHLDRDVVAIDGYRERLSHALDLDPALRPHALTGADLDEIISEDASMIQAALRPQEAGPYRHFTEANGGDERFDYDESSREALIANLPILTRVTEDEANLICAGRARRRAELRAARPGRMLDHDLQEEIAAYVAEALPPPKELTPEHAIYFEEEVCRFYANESTKDHRWQQSGLLFPNYIPW